MNSLQYDHADLTADRDTARAESDALRLKIEADGQVRGKIEELILAVRRLSSERDRLLALTSETSADRCVFCIHVLYVYIYIYIRIYI